VNQKNLKLKAMKNLKLILAIVMVLPITISFGQRTTKTYLDLMVNVASTNFNYGNSNSAVSDYKKRDKGIQAGLSFQAGITPAFSLVSELYYMRKGGILKSGNPFSTDETRFRLNTVELPVLARLHLGKFYLNAGPSVSYAFSGKHKEGNESEKLSFKNSSDGFKHVDAGIQAGGGFEFPLKQRRLALDIRYNHGLTNISRGSQMYNRGIMVSVYFSKPWKTNPLARKSQLDL
jgi:hypothetical protein